MKLRFGIGALLAGLLCALSFAEQVEEKYPDGKLKLRYTVDDQQRKSGLLEEFFENSKHKIKAIYKAGELEGTSTEYHENGKTHIVAVYKGGKLNGNYTEYTEKGEKKLTATYKDGKLNGTLTHYEKNKGIFTQAFKDGEMVTGRSPAQIKRKLAEIDPDPKKKPDNDAEENEAALRRLKAYRYLAGLPYENLALDGEMNRACVAGAKLCEKIGKLDHTPANPGLPDDEYKLGYKGTSHSNLAMGYQNLPIAVDGWMDDSDPSNIERVGHRRWCINPPMQKTGFGHSGRFYAMWSVDMSQKAVPDYDFVAWPPKGYLPVEYFGAKHAWSVSFNPTKYKLTSSKVKVGVFQTDIHLNKGEALKNDHFNVDTSGAGIPNCVIFHPEGVVIEPGKRYLVEVEGVGPAPVRYPVEFIKLD